MANGRQTDVSLVIRARDEASRAIDAIETAFQGLLGVQQQVATGSQKTASGIAAVVSTLAGLDRAYTQIAGAAKQGSDALDRQAASIAANKAQLASLEAQSQGAARAIDQLSVKLVDALLNKADAGPLRAQIAEVRAEMGRLDAEARKLQRTIDTQESNFTKSSSTLRDVERNTRLAAAASTFASKEAEDYRRSLEQQNATAERTAALQAAIARSTDLRGGKSAEDSASVFRSAGLTSFEREAARAAEENAAAVARLRNELNPTAQIQAQMNRALEQAKRWYDQGEISAEEYAAAQLLIKRNADAAAQALGRQTAGGGRPTLFGLKPYELQNLGYQVNDVVTQLASGTSLTQTLAQQGGQILQLFPRVGASIVAAFKNPVVLAFVVTLGSLVVALREVGSEAERVRGFLGLLTASADGAAFDPKALNTAAEALDRYGLSAEDAVKAVRIFVKEGVDQRRLVEFGEAAANLSEVMGIDLKDAAEEVAQAFTGGYDAVKKLDDSYNVLTAAQREQIRTLFEQGRATEAQNMAMAVFSQRFEKAASDMRGPWADAARELSGAWREFVGWLSDTAPIRAAGEALAGLGRDVARLMRQLRGLKDESQIVGEIAAKRQTIADLEGRLAGVSPGSGRRPTIENALSQHRAELAELEKQVGAARERNSLDAAGVSTRAELVELTKKQSQDLARETAELKKKEDVEAAVAEARRKAVEHVEKEFKFADQATKQAYIAQKVAEARESTQKRIADQTKREADEAKRAAEERRKGFIRDIQDNGREDVLATARRFEGQNETRNRGNLQQFFRDNGVNVDPKMVAWCAAFVNAVLAANGIKGTTAPDGSAALNARSFLNFGQDSTSNPQEGDIVILRRGRNAANGHVGFFQGFDERGNVRVLGGNQSDGVNTQSFRRDDVLGFRRIPNAGQIAKEEFDQQEKLRDSQQKFNQSLTDQVARRRQDTEQLKLQNTLDGNALLLAQRKAAIEDAILKKTQEAQKAGVDTDSAAFKEQIETLRQVEGAYFDATNAKKAYQNTVDDVQQPVNDLTALRDQIQQQIEVARQAGNGAMVANLETQLDTVNLKLSESIQKALEFYRTLENNPAALAALGLTAEQVDRIKLGLEAADLSTKKFTDRVVITNQTIASTFANQATNAIDRFSEAVANGEDVFRSLGQAFLQFAAEFLRNIAQMIIQQIIFNLVSRALSSLIPGGLSFGGAAPGVASGGNPLSGFTKLWHFDPTIQFHDGGIVGAGGTPRLAHPDWFKNAIRYHTGGIAGLAPNEVGAILERGEEVLTRDDPRHRANGGLGAGSPIEDRVKNVMYFDPAEALAAALATRSGEKALLTWFRANGGAVRQSIG